MGIDFSHGNAHWAYSGFNRFRTRLAAEIGISLDRMEGFQGILHKPEDDHLILGWDTVKDPIAPFLYHSDCDGELTVKECRAIAPRIEKLVKDWPEEDRDRSNALELVKGMKAAIEENEELGFH